MILLVVISFSIVAVDQLLKWIMLNMLVYGDSIPIIKDFFSLTLVFNKGAAFGILQGVKYIFLILPAITIIIILVLFIKARDKETFLIAFGLLLGGTIGNFLDRLKYGYVVDFFDFFIKSWHWPVFNIADSCICVGVFLLFIKMFNQSKCGANTHS
jgi:signal peptidase II